MAAQTSIAQFAQITETLQKAKQLRNYFQLERDAIMGFYNQSKKELDSLKAELLLREHEMEEAEYKHQVEMKVYKQKVRHLLYEHKVQVQALTEQSEIVLAESTDQHKAKIGHLKKDKRESRTEQKELISQHEEDIRTMRMQHKRMLDITRDTAEKAMKDMQDKYEKKIKVLRDELELRRKAEVHDIEERKNAHIKELMSKHDSAFKEMKEYYNDITSNNLDLIKSLKEEVANMGKNQLYNEKLMFDIAQENKKLNDPLTKAKKEVENLRHELANYEKDKMSLRNTRSRLTSLEEQCKKLEGLHKKKLEDFDKVVREKDALVANYEDSLTDVKRRANEKQSYLDKMLNELEYKFNEKDAQLTGVLQAAQLEPSALEIVTRKLEDMLETKQRAIKDLHFELAKCEQQHRDVRKAYEAKCRGAGIATLSQWSGEGDTKAARS